MVRAAFGRSALEPSTQTLPKRGIHRILVCHVSHTLGNTLLLTPLLRELQHVYPGAEVDVVSRSPVASDIFGKFRCVRHVYRLPAHGLASPLRVAGIVRELRARRYDLAIDPCIRSQSDRIGVLLAGARHTLGYLSPGKNGGLTHAVAAPSSVRHIGQLPVYLIRCALQGDDTIPYPALDICLTHEERVRGREQLSDLFSENPSLPCPVIALFCNATGAKYLGVEWWRRFATQVEKQWPSCRIVEIIAAAGGSLLDDTYPTYYSSDLRSLASVVSAASLFVSADCGVMHLACATGVPTVGMFGNTDPAEWGPYGHGNLAIDITPRTPEEAAEGLPPAGEPRASSASMERAQRALI